MIAIKTCKGRAQIKKKHKKMQFRIQIVLFKGSVLNYAGYVFALDSCDAETSSDSHKSLFVKAPREHLSLTCEKESSGGTFRP